MSYKLKNKEKGFTIIEVMIVLAIAGLIMLIVFLAVPALQRNSRNTSRKSDASRISSAITTWVSNNNGNVPDGGNLAGILTDAGSLSQYTGYTTAGDKSTACAAGTAVASKLVECLEGSGAANVQLTQLAAGTDGLVLAVGATCNAADTIGAGSSSRQMALFYTQEPASGKPNWTCTTL